VKDFAYDVRAPSDTLSQRVPAPEVQWMERGTTEDMRSSVLTKLWALALLWNVSVSGADLRLGISGPTLRM